MSKLENYPNENELVARVNPIDDSYVDLFRERQDYGSHSPYDYLCTIHIDTLHPTIDFRLFNDLEEVRIAIRVIGGEKK